MKIIIPQIGDTMDPYTIVEWFYKEGDYVEKGKPLLSVEVGKANVDVEAPGSGVLAKILIEADEEVLPLQVVGELD